jgi:hypothetical protein
MAEWNGKMYHYDFHSTLSNQFRRENMTFEELTKGREIKGVILSRMTSCTKGGK